MCTAVVQGLTENRGKLSIKGNMVSNFPGRTDVDVGDICPKWSRWCGGDRGAKRIGWSNRLRRTRRTRKWKDGLDMSCQFCSANHFSWAVAIQNPTESIYLAYKWELSSFLRRNWVSRLTIGDFFAELNLIYGSRIKFNSAKKSPIVSMWHFLHRISHNNLLSILCFSPKVNMRIYH